jgi:carnitine monooxygenase subunit
MLKTTDGSLRAVPFPVSDPERIPAQRYYDEEFYQAELDHVWPHVWQMACRLEQIPEVGDWIEYQNLGKSVIVVRTEAGVKAFHNACRHRGVPIAGGKGNDHGNCRQSGFVCPFHGWRFNMDGENTFVYGRHLFSEHQLDPDDINLIPCRVETAIGCAFINFDDDAPSYRETIGSFIDRAEAHNVEQLRAEWWFGTVLPANWKIAMEAFMEGLHVMATHPQLQHVAPMIFDAMYLGETKGSNIATDRNKSVRENILAHFGQMERTGIGMAGMVHAKEIEIARGLLDIDLPEDHDEALMTWYGAVQAEITRQLREKGEPVPDLNEVSVSAPIGAVDFLFPNYFLLPFFTSFSSYRIRPLGPESCFFELWSLTLFPEGQEPDPVMEPTILAYDSPEFPPIPRQDYSNIPAQQIGLHAKGFDFMRLSKDIEGLVSNYQRVIDGYIGGVPQEKLAKATTKLADNFDGEIEDLGF